MSQDDFDREFAQEFEAIADELATLDARYRQIRRDRQQRDRLTEHARVAHGDRQQLSRLRDRLNILELNLESSLFSWTGLREPVWFGLRYGGLGFILGWLLHACTQ